MVHPATTAGGFLEYKPLLSLDSAPVALEASLQGCNDHSLPATVYDRLAVYQAQNDSALLRESAIDLPLWVRIHSSTAEREPQIAVLFSAIQRGSAPTVVEISPASHIVDAARIRKFVDLCHEMGLEVALTRGVLMKPKMRSTVSTLIEIAHHARMRVVAEAVEGADTWEWLRVTRCDAVECPAVAPPMRIEDVIRFVPEYELRLEEAKSG